MDLSKPFQVQRKTGPINIGIEEDTQLDYDVKEQNWMEMELRVKKTPSDYNAKPLEDARRALGLEPDKAGSHPNIHIEFEKPDTGFQTNFLFRKRIGYLVGPKTLLSLDVDFRSLNMLKFYGLRPSVTHQYDKLTKLRLGFSMMPGSTAVILGASRAITDGM